MLDIRRFLLTAAMVLALGYVAPTYAQVPPPDDFDDEDVNRLPGQAGSQREQSRSEGPLVEVARGFYVQADPGMFDFIGALAQPDYLYSFGQAMNWGPSLRLHAGYDILTSGIFGLSAQGTFWQLINDGLAYVPGQIPSSPAQGDTRSYLVEAALRPTLLLGSSGRFNLFLRLGAGVGFLEQALSEVPDPTIYSSLEFGVNPRPFVSGGGGLEYYTRLSHFSFTFIEVNALYMTGLDVALGINFAGFKYTF